MRCNGCTGDDAIGLFTPQVLAYYVQFVFTEQTMDQTVLQMEQTVLQMEQTVFGSPVSMEETFISLGKPTY